MFHLLINFYLFSVVFSCFVLELERATLARVNRTKQVNCTFPSFPFISFSFPVMPAAKRTKVSSTKKEKLKATLSAAENSSPTRISRRTAPASTHKASPSPSPVPKKKKGIVKESVYLLIIIIIIFYCLAATSKKSKKTESEAEESEHEHEKLVSKSVAKSVPLVSKSSSKTHKSSSSGSAKKVIRTYLILYNTLSAMAWAFLLFNLARSFFFENVHNHQVLFQKTGLYLAYLQTVALLEVLHAALGWVRSGVISNVIQIASRLFVIWVAGVYGGSGKHWAYAMMSVAWALSDFTRYAYYLTQLTEASAPALKWARYNFFLVLYPVGTLGEAILIFLARMKWSKNLFLNYGLLTVLAIYTPGKHCFYNSFINS